MDFDELRRLHRSMSGAVDETLRQMRERDSVMRSIREMNSAASSLREMNAASHLQEAVDSAARTLREVSAARSFRDEVGLAARNLQEMNAITGLQETEAALGLREMDPRVRGLDVRELDRITGRPDRREMEALTGGLDLREMDLVTGGVYDQARKYVELEDSIQRQFRERLHDFERAGVTAVIREVASQAANEDWRRAVAEVTEQLSSAFGLARGSDFEQLNRRAEMLNDLTAGSAVFGMLARELARSASAGALTPALAGGFGGELLGYIEGAEAVDSETAIADFLKAFLVWLLTLAQRLPVTKLSNEAIFNIFLAVATILYQKYDSAKDIQAIQEKIEQVREEGQQHREEARQDKEEVLQEMREMEARLTERLSQAQAKDDDAREYVVIKAAKLRNGPGKEFESLEVLPPNVQVEELGKEGEWMHVEYFDYAEGELRAGWISVELLVEKRDGDQD